MRECTNEGRGSLSAALRIALTTITHPTVYGRERRAGKGVASEGLYEGALKDQFQKVLPTFVLAELTKAPPKMTVRGAEARSHVALQETWKLRMNRSAA